MAEYIERESAYEDFEKCNSENPKWTPSRVKTLIARQKAADVAPVKHGGWKKIGYKWVCSNCRSRLTLHGTPTDNNIFYCPACGAKMDLGENNGEA